MMNGKHRSTISLRRRLTSPKSISYLSRFLHNSRALHRITTALSPRPRQSAVRGEEATIRRTLSNESAHGPQPRRTRDWLRPCIRTGAFLERRRTLLACPPPASGVSGPVACSLAEGRPRPTACRAGRATGLRAPLGSGRQPCSSRARTSSRCPRRRTRTGIRAQPRAPPSPLSRIPGMTP